MFARSMIAIAALVTASAASAQWVPGMEITGQQVQVQTNGVMNTITFEPNGVARITSPTGATVVDATWTASAGKLCLQTSSTFDCYPYAAPFTANVPVAHKRAAPFSFVGVKPPGATGCRHERRRYRAARDGGGFYASFSHL
jgi:hypothetical protein